MKADDIRRMLAIKKENFKFKLKTTCDITIKTDATKKYRLIKKMLNEMNDLKIVTWYYERHAKDTEKRRKRGIFNESETGPR
jgi:hypothetical protein